LIGPGVRGATITFAVPSCRSLRRDHVYNVSGMILTPGGIGAYAYLMAKVLELNGVEYTLGLANGTIQWFAQFLIIIVLGGLSLIMLPIINKQVK